MGQGEENRPIVLYVDDIQANLMLFEASFDDVFDVRLAESGKDALDILKNEDIHVLVSDQNMPGMTGNELLEIVTSEYPDIMRFMITAYTDYETVVEAINKGHLYGFFNKPYNIDDVKRSIDRSLEVRNLRLKNREMIVKLEKANDALLTIDRSKTKFLASVTDEIRTPINKIMTAVHMIKDKIDSKELSELLQLLDTSVSRLEVFSDSTRHLVHLNKPDFKIVPIDVSLKEIIEVGIIERGNLLKSAGINIGLTENAEDIVIKGEFDLIQVSFSSLLGFLIEHAEKGAKILVGMHTNQQNIHLDILTSGAVLSEKELLDLKALSSKEQSIFDRDLRMEIMLANEIMTAHQGSLSFLDEESNSGFSMIFPM